MDDLIGTVDNPLPSAYSDVWGGGLLAFITNIIRLLFVVAGVLLFFNIIIAGYDYMMAAGDSKKLAKAWSRIWNSLIGLILVVGSFALAGILSYLFFGDAGFIFKPQIYGPSN